MFIVTEIAGRTSKWRLEKNLHRTYTHSFEVFTDIPNLDGLTVNNGVMAFFALQTGLPVGIGRSYPLDPFALLTDVDSKQAAEKPEVGCRWLSILTFDTLAPDPQQSNSNPTDNPSVLSFGTKIIEDHVIKDLDGKAFVNTAGDTYESGLVIPRTIQTVQIEVNTATFDSGPDGRDVNMRTNADTWRGFAPDTLLLESVNAKQEHQNGMVFWKRTYNISIAPNQDDGWTKYVLAAGYNYLDGTNRLTRFVDRFGNPASTPRPLRENGGPALGPGTLAPYFYQAFRIYDKISFTSRFGA